MLGGLYQMLGTGSSLGTPHSKQLPSYPDIENKNCNVMETTSSPYLPCIKGRTMQSLNTIKSSARSKLPKMHGHFKISAVSHTSNLLSWLSHGNLRWVRRERIRSHVATDHLKSATSMPGHATEPRSLATGDMYAQPVVCQGTPRGTDSAKVQRKIDEAIW